MHQRISDLREASGRTHAATTAMRRGISLVNALRIKEMIGDADSRAADPGVAQTIEEEAVTATDATIEMGGIMTVIDEETVAEAVVVKIEETEDLPVPSLARVRNLDQGQEIVSLSLVLPEAIAMLIDVVMIVVRLAAMTATIVEMTVVMIVEEMIAIEIVVVETVMDQEIVDAVEDATEETVVVERAATTTTRIVAATMTTTIRETTRMRTTTELATTLTERKTTAAQIKTITA